SISSINPLTIYLNSLSGLQVTFFVSSILIFHIWDQNYHNYKNARENKLGQIVHQIQSVPLHFAYCRQSQIVRLFDVPARISVHNHNLHPSFDNAKTVVESVHEHLYARE